MRATQEVASEDKAFGRSRAVPIKLPGLLLALLMILLADPACAGSRFRSFHGAGFPAFYPGLVLGFFGGYFCGYNCGLGFYNPGYGYFNGYGFGYGNDYSYGGGYGHGSGYDRGFRSGYDSGYRNGAGNAVAISNGLTGGYVPDPIGAEIAPLIIPRNCWVRRAAYDPSGAYFGQVLVNLCRTSDRVTVTGSKPQAKALDTGPGQPAIRPQNP
jgi:hypothetical protein